MGRCGWWEAVCLRINDAHHSVLTVPALRAVEPDRLSVVEHDVVYRHLGCSNRDGHEAREQAGDVGCDVADGLTGLVEGRLHDGVVLCGGTCISGDSTRPRTEMEGLHKPWGRSGIGLSTPRWL